MSALRPLGKALSLLGAAVLAFSLTTTAPPFRGWAAAADGTAAPGVAESLTSWYFAEGYTGEGFQEWLCVYNPGEETAGVRVDLIYPDDPPSSLELPVAPCSRATLNVNAAAAKPTDVSLVVESPLPVVAERPIYFTYRNKWRGCTAAPGIPAPGRDWGFAEGTTRDGFEEWLCLLNPGGAAVEADVIFSLEDGSQREVRLELPPLRRRTIEVNAVVGAGHDVSAHVRGGGEILAERAMYFSYRGRWQGGHASPGCPLDSYSTTRLFAEGYTGPGFETWLCLFLPSWPEAEGAVVPAGLDPVPVTLTYFFEDGSSRNELLELTLDRRFTLFLNERVGEGRNVSVRVDGPAGLMAERPMYFNYRGTCRGGHVTWGVDRPREEWLFAEGTLRPGFEEWLCLLNPGGEEAQATVELFTGEGESSQVPLTVMPGSRHTLCLNDAVPQLAGEDISCRVRSTQPLAAERSLYRPGYDFETANALDDLAVLTLSIGPRVEGTPQEEAAAAYLAERLRGCSVGGRGFAVEVQPVPLPNGSFTRNVVGKLAPPGRELGASPLVILGAHLDTRDATGSPGANDNGSGCVTLLEVARCLVQLGSGAEVWVVFFGGEELLVPGTDLHHFGSRWFVDHLGSGDRARLHGAFIADMVGVGSQLYARTMGIGPMDLCDRLTAFAAGKGIYLPYLRSGNSSDHEPFEKAGLPAVWLEYKDDPYYHTPADSIDKINPEYLRLTGSLILDYLRSL